MLKLAPAFAAVLLCATPVFADLSGRVASVHDGGTLTLDGSKVRLWGIILRS
jgi:hypothetical protein